VTAGSEDQRIQPAAFPAIGKHVVIVFGPSAAGIYDLARGDFHRVTHAAAKVLEACDGETPLSTWPKEQHNFIYEALERGLIEVRPSPSRMNPTKLEDVILPLRPPRFAWVEITSKCNQACLHCFLGEDLNSVPHVPVDHLCKQADDLSTAGVRQVVLSGGEPTLHPHFGKILDYFASKSFELSVLTNGSYKRFADLMPKFIEHSVTVKIPLLGWGASHDRMAGLPGSFERVVTSVRACVAAGVRLQLGSTVTALNAVDIPQIRAFAQELGVSLEFSPVFLIGCARDHRADLVPDSMPALINACQIGNCQQQRNQTTPQHSAASSAGDYAAVDLRQYLTAHHECGQKIIALLANGKVTPCLLLRQKSNEIGDLRRNTLLEVVSGLSDRRSFDESMKLERIPGCRNCEARFVCKAGGCPASAYALTGFVAQKNPLYDKCYYAEVGRSVTDSAVHVG
jgi:radical SAM protein with 4Fe4S-binding SPASM domain